MLSRDDSDWQGKSSKFHTSFEQTAKALPRLDRCSPKAQLRSVITFATYAVILPSGSIIGNSVKAVISST